MQRIALFRLQAPLGRGAEADEIKANHVSGDSWWVYNERSTHITPWNRWSWQLGRHSRISNTVVKRIAHVRTSRPNWTFHVVVWQTTSKNCTKECAARAARLYFLVQPIKSLICGVVVAVVISPKYGASANTTSTEARTSSENVTSRFCNHFSIIQSYYAWTMCSSCPGIKLEPALGT